MIPDQMQETIQKIEALVGCPLPQVPSQIEALVRAFQIPPVALVVTYHPAFTQRRPVVGGTPLPPEPVLYERAALELEAAAQYLRWEANLLKERQNGREPGDEIQGRGDSSD